MRVWKRSERQRPLLRREQAYLHHELSITHIALSPVPESSCLFGGVPKRRFLVFQITTQSWVPNVFMLEQFRKDLICMAVRVWNVRSWVQIMCLASSNRTCLPRPGFKSTTSVNINGLRKCTTHIMVDFFQQTP